MNAPRDGVIARNGLTADFRFTKPHVTIGDSSWIETAFGEIPVKDSLLTYDPPRQMAAGAGILRSNGLTADVRFLRVHPQHPSMHLVDTSTGEHWAHVEELTYDPPLDLTPKAGSY